MGNLKDNFDDILEHADQIAHAVIRKQGSQWCIFSKKGKKLQCFPTKKQAQDRLRQIEFFKNRDKK
jgi:hypothetical protein